MSRVFIVLFIVTFLAINAISSNVSSRPQVVNVGALICFDSMIGRVAKVAISAAVDDVNSDPTILKGTKLKVAMQDTKTSDFLGIVEGTLLSLISLFFFLLFLSLKNESLTGDFSFI